MTYFRVRKEFAQRRKFRNNPKNCDFLIAHELYTKAERKQLTEIPDKAFERIEIPKSKIYWFFGARFENRVAQ